MMEPAQTQAEVFFHCIHSFNSQSTAWDLKLTTRQQLGETGQQVTQTTICMITWSFRNVQHLISCLAILATRNLYPTQNALIQTDCLIGNVLAPCTKRGTWYDGYVQQAFDVSPERKNVTRQDLFNWLFSLYAWYSSITLQCLENLLIQNLIPFDQEVVPSPKSGRIKQRSQEFV